MAFLGKKHINIYLHRESMHFVVLSYFLLFRGNPSLHSFSQMRMFGQHHIHTLHTHVQNHNDCIIVSQSVLPVIFPTFTLRCTVFKKIIDIHRTYDLNHSTVQRKTTIARLTSLTRYIDDKKSQKSRDCSEYGRDYRDLYHYERYTSAKTTRLE